jgi:hypothetical protein
VCRRRGGAKHAVDRYSSKLLFTRKCGGGRALIRTVAIVTSTGTVNISLGLGEAEAESRCILRVFLKEGLHRAGGRGWGGGGGAGDGGSGGSDHVGVSVEGVGVRGLGGCEFICSVVHIGNVSLVGNMLVEDILVGDMLVSVTLCECVCG